MMNRVLILLFMAGFFLFMWFMPASQDIELEEGYESLFDGVSLDGWYKIGGESTYHVEDGSIVGVHGPGENTFLRTERTFTDFVLKMEMRWDEPGNSGVLFRAQQRDGSGRAYGYQYELDHSERAWSGGIYDEARRGWLYNLEQNEEARNAIRLEDWNQVHIEARGPLIKTWINGVPAADIVDVFDAEGVIALQVHSGDVGIMRWRNIRLKPLESLGAPGEPLDGRRQVRDFAVDLELPVCEEPTVLQFRRARATGGRPQYVELSLTTETAQARVQYPGKLEELEPLRMLGSDRQRVRVVAEGQRMTLSVGEQDVARLDVTGLPDRGMLQVEASPCGEAIEVGELAWTDLTPRNAEPQFYQTLDTEPAPVYSASEALETFRIAPGYEVELVAAEPLIGDPVAAAWDEYGRLYVVEMRSYMPDAYGTDRGSPMGRVVRLEDTDGDGRMDTSEVFLDGLTYPRAVAVTNDGILVGVPPQLWLCELPTRDALCSDKRSLGEYGTAEGDANVEHLENKLLPGLDNWYYNSKSSRSLKIVDGELENRHSLFRGQWGIGKDDYGRLFYNHNSNLITADFFAAEDLLDEKSLRTPPGLGRVLTAPEEVFSVRVNPGVNRAYLDGTLRADGRLQHATSASGLAPYRGQAMPELNGHIFVAEPAANVVAQFAMSEEGLELSAEHRLYPDEQWGQVEFLGSIDERFRPVDVMNGPDGALYIVDMYRGLIQDEHYLTEELREQVLQRELDAPIGLGRIWRIKRADTTREELPDIAGADAAALIDLLSHPNGWTRDTAQRLLLTHAGKETDALRKLATSEASLPAIHALWVLQGRGELDRATVLKAMASKEPHRQQQALRAGAGVLDAADLAMLAGQPYAARTQMQLAFALGEHAGGEPGQLALLRLLLRGYDSPFSRQAVVRSVRGSELEFMVRVVDSELFDEESEGAAEFARQLALSAYSSIRPDVSSTDPAPKALLDLLSLLQTQQGDRAWVQVAMLDGLYSTTRETGFVAARFAEAPPIFLDTEISESDPLWDARLKGRRAFTWPGDEIAAGIKPLAPDQIAQMDKGKALYPACAACHGEQGDGISGLGPALAGSSWVVGPPEQLGRIILQGFDTPRNGVMPPHEHLAELDDETLAGLMLYMRRSWGNTADPVSLEMVEKIQATSAGRSKPWTEAELAEVEIDRGYDKYVGDYKISFVTMTVSIQDGELYLSVPLNGEGPLQEVSEGVFLGSADSQQVRIEFEANADGSIPAFRMFLSNDNFRVERVD